MYIARDKLFLFRAPVYHATSERLQCYACVGARLLLHLGFELVPCDGELLLHDITQIHEVIEALF